MAALLEQELMAAMAPTQSAPPPPALGESGRDLENDVLRMAAEALRMPIEQLDPQENLANFGVDSIAITEIMAKISRYYAIAVAPTTFFEAKHLDDLAAILRQRYAKAIAAHYAAKAPAPAPAAVTVPSPPASAAAQPDWLARHRKARRQTAAIPASTHAAADSAQDAPIAIIAMEGIFPQSPDLAAFEAHLRAGDDCIGEVPPDRWDWRTVAGDPRHGPFTQVKSGGFAPGVDLFDAGFFRIAPREAELIDPQHRLFMQCVVSLIERGGYAPSALAGQKVGLFLGINLLDYTNMANRAGLMDAQQMTGLGHAFCPNRLSFWLDIHGPSEVIDTACSSSLVALNRAIMAIRHEGCPLAIAGGSNLMLSADQHVMFSQVGMLAPDGRCKTFSAQADGYGRADGVGAVLLKRLDRAEADGDPILGIIRACVEHHGGTTTSLTAPNPKAQARLIVEAHRRAGGDPRAITLIECHGTGTALGDPVEVDGLKQAFAQLYADHGLAPPTQPHCGLGSVKSNIGHCETAAGIAGLIKVLLALNSGVQYRTLNSTPVNPLIDTKGSPFYLVPQTQPWPRPIIDGAEMPRRAGLSSFGAGGTNVHAVIEEYRDARPPQAAGPRPLVIPVSAHAEQSLRRMVEALLPLVAACDLDDLAHTLQRGRDSRAWRIAFVVSDAAELIRAMTAFLNGQSAAVKAERSAMPVAAVNPVDIATSWMRGGVMDWTRLDPAKRRRLSLPGTQFVGKRFWLPLAEQKKFFDLQDNGKDCWHVALNENSFFLADHRLGGQAILPGVAYLELARAAGIRAGLPTQSWRNVVWIKPMAVNGQLTARISLHRGEGLMEIASLAADGQPVLHAQIRLSQEVPPTPAKVDLAALQASHQRRFDAPHIYGIFQDLGLNYGPGHRAISHLSTGVDDLGRTTVLAQLTLPDALAHSLDDLPLHPSLLDGAFQAAIGVALGEDGHSAEGAALPFAVGTVHMLGPCTSRMWAHVRPARTAEVAARVRSLDIDLFDADGNLRLRLGDFATRLAASESRPTTLGFVPVWRDIAGPGRHLAGRRLLLSVGAFTAPPGWEAQTLDGDFPRQAQALLTVLQGLDGPACLRVVVSDDQRQSALGVAGMLRSAGLEKPGLHGQVLLAPSGAALGDSLDNSAPSGALLRLVNHGLQAEIWEETALAPAPSPWQDGKVYVITGGLGGLGRLLTAAIRHAAPKAVVVLCGRSEPDGAARSWLDQTRAHYHACDLADAARTRALVDKIRAAHGRIDGVLHAAGMISDQPLGKKTSHQLAAILAPKVTGLVNLCDALGPLRPEFFVTFSSLSAVFGNPGQADYAAANGFMDGLADTAGLISVAWPLWAEGGMAMDAQTQALMTRTTGLVTLDTPAGMQALHAAIAAGHPRLAVARGEAAKIRRRFFASSETPAAPIAPASIDHALLGDKLLARIMRLAAQQLKVETDDLDADQDLTEYGFDSIGFTQFANGLNAALDLELAPTLFFEHPSLGGLSAHLAQAHGPALAAKLGVAAAPAAEPTAPAEPVIAAPTIAIPPTARGRNDGVAIIAMTGLFPGAADLDEFWHNLETAKDCIGEIPSERWNWRDYWGDPLTQPGRCHIRWGGFIEQMAEFDNTFFGLSAPQARMMDPQQRLLLTQAWRLLEDAAIAPRSLSGSDTGVFIGTADTGYGRLLAEAGTEIEGHSMTGLAPSLGPNRISYHFNFHGPSVAVETACSSALVAVNRAVEAIQAGHCRLAMAGGVNALLSADSFVGFAKAGMLSPDGRSKPFSADANGYARGEGIGLVLLKSLADAQRDGDRILAVIRASGENHGGHASSLTAPNPKAQAALLRQVHGRSGLDPRGIGYIEAHGTGTPLGDPIEVEALRAAFADLCAEAEAQFGPAPAMCCQLGSVKSNIGHLELAAGIAGLIKVVLQMRHGRIAKTLHCDQINPYVKLAGSPFTIASQGGDWPRRQGAPRRAGVSSFGFGGSNAHVVIEEYVAAPSAPISPAGPSLLVLSGHTPEALGQWAEILRRHLETTEAPLAAIAATLQNGREALEHRLAFVAADKAEAVRRLEAFRQGSDDTALYQGRVKNNRAALSVLENDDAVRHAIAGLAARGRADGLAELWVRGFAVNWGDISGRHPRVPLPPYPLARTRHWPRMMAQAVAQPVFAPVLPVEMEVEEEAEASESPAAFDALAALTDIAASILEVDGAVLDPDSELGEFGFDSITMTGFASKVNAELSLTLTPADFFEFATLRRLAGHIGGAAKPRPQTTPKQKPKPAVSIVPVERQSAVPVPNSDDPIVITGISCCFPQSPDADSFWQTLIQGRDCITRIPADRWDWQAIDGEPKQMPGKTNIHWGGFIDSVFQFDPLFFGISPREARLMDPQQRLLMTHVWKALEDSGHNPRAFAGRKVGLFVATSSSGYRDIIGDDTGAEGYVATGAVPSVGPNRVSYFLDWHGPSEPVETACSSTLVALHRAMAAIASGDCEMAVIGGVNTMVTPEAHINFAKAGMLAPDGRCKTFSADADGYGRGEGIGVMVLRRLSAAQADGDPILAVVKASAVNHGGRANSLTAPNTAAQADLLRDAQARAGIDAATIGYVEAHGTGTALGDPVEINALKTVFANHPGDCVLGSVKTNIGHLELAAGAAGLIKVVLQMQHATIAPSLHCQRQNPYIDLTGTALRIARTAQPWARLTAPDGQPLPRRAGVSSFGFGGVNAHVILEEYQGPRPLANPATGPVLIVLSARDDKRLVDQAAALSGFLSTGALSEDDLADLATTLQIGREAMRQRLAFVATSMAQVIQTLDRFIAGRHDGLSLGRQAAGGKKDIIRAVNQPLDTLARAWADGTDIAWVPHGPVRRLRLPSHVFAPETYHIKLSPPNAAAPGPFTRTLTADAFFLRDHQVMGAGILPGAMGLELARAAASSGSAFVPLALTRIVWQQPLRLDHGSVTVSVPIAGQSLRLLSPDSPTPHMIGQAEPLEGPAGRLDVAALQARCPQPLDQAVLYATYGDLGLNYGPTMRPIQQLWRGHDEVLAQLSLPTAAIGDFVLHPSMVDGAFQAALGLFLDQGGEKVTALPFGLDRLEVFAPTTARMWVHLRRGSSANGIHKLDLDVAADDGAIVLRLGGFTLRDVKQKAPAKSDSLAAVLKRLGELVAAEANISAATIEAEAPLEEYGIDSIMITRLTDALEADYGPLPKTLFFEYRSLAALAEYFAATHGAPPVSAPQAPEAPAPHPVQPLAAHEPIAIIGMAGRFPAAADLDQFWRNLEAGRDCVGEIPPERWDWHQNFEARPGTMGKTYGKWGGFVDDFDRFDPTFFNISPREAEFMDPQERLFLQCAWETLEDAGHTRQSLAPASVGVFVGVMYQEYQLYGVATGARGQTMALNGSAATMANRVSYFCGFSGPSMTLDTMCSSSLTAIHLACNALRAGDCTMALAGGVNLSLHPNKYLGLAQARFLSSNGRCESFGQGGDGYVPGEGVGAVLLKPLSRALAEGDRVLAVIRASAVNHGGKTNGYTVPNPDAQAAVIETALERAGVQARHISYVEAHGTGTKLGDPIEIAALAKAFGRQTTDRGFCAIGSVKSNIGHCESAAGMAGLAKVVLQMRHGRLAASLHAETLNPGIDFAATPFVVQRHGAPWPASDHGRPRLAGLSSFGAGGANAHLIIEEFVPAPAPAARLSGPEIFPLSARDPQRLGEAAKRLRSALAPLAESDLAAIAFTLQQGREAFEQRLAIVAETKAELLAGLDDFIAGQTPRHGGRATRMPAFTGGDIHAQAAAWVSGAAISWRQNKPARLALPPYPFARERYWLPQGAAMVGAKPLPLVFAPHWPIQAARLDHDVNDRRLVLLANPPAGLAPALAAALGPAQVIGLHGDYPALAAQMLSQLQELLRQRPQQACVQWVHAPQADAVGLAGMLRSLRQERPGLRCQSIAIAADDPALIERLNADWRSHDDDIAYENGQRRVRRWREVPFAGQAQARPWRDGGVYVISGGAGGIGLHVAEAIAARCQRPVLWLIGRSPLSPAARQRLEGLNASFHYRQLDVTDAAAIAALIDDVIHGHGRLNGIVHAAGITRDSLLMRKSASDLAQVLAAKVDGAIALDRASQDIELDFLALFASASGALGNGGQSDYAAANAFLDHFAHSRNALVASGRRHGHTVAIDWPYWADGGMRLGDEIISAMERAVGARPLATDAAMDVLDFALTQRGESQLLVLDGDHDRLRHLLGAAPVAAPAAPAPVAPPIIDTVRDKVAGNVRDKVIDNVRDKVAGAFAQVLHLPVDKLDAQAPLDRFGIDSVSALEVMAALESQFGPLAPTLLFEHPSINALSAHLQGLAPAPEPAPAPMPTAKAGDIAIIAVSGRFPGADTVEDLWSLLAGNSDAITEVPAWRGDMAKLYSPRLGEPGASHCRWGGFIDGIDRFDAEFFGYSPRAAALADPQERLFLQNTWHLLERAGHSRAHLARAYDGKVGVFVGAMFQHYGAIDTDAETRALLALNSYGAIANKVSYFFDLHGPSLAVDCMCSSGLQAVHQACQSLQAGECRLAIAGGVSLSPRLSKFQGLSRVGLIGSAPSSRAFADGDGYLPAEAVGAVLLKPLADALRDNDAIIGVIKASRANHGGHSAGFGTPNGSAQAALIRETIAQAGIDARSIGYVEIAASGAGLGDAIEARALAQALGERPLPCPIGSAKANLGHAEAASGLVQLTKVLLQLSHERLLPSLAPQTANPAVDFAACFLAPVWQGQDWPRLVIDGRPQPRRAALSSFGAGGSNVHMIVEEAPGLAPAAATVGPWRFVVSARTTDDLAVVIGRLVAFLRIHPDTAPERLAHSLTTGRERLDHSIQIIAASIAEVIAKLEAARPHTWEDDALADNGRGPALVLPDYPFAGESFWIEETPRPAGTLAPQPVTAPQALDLILDVLAAELGRTRAAIDVDADFAALGVDSMTALRLGFAVEESFGCRLERRDLQSFSTPRALAAHIHKVPASTTKALSAAPAAGPWRMAMTAGQQGLWVIQSLYPQTSIYNVPLAFRLHDIDLDCLDQAWDWLVAAVPILAARVAGDETAPSLEPARQRPRLQRQSLPKGMEPQDFARRLIAQPFELKAGPTSRGHVLGGGALGHGHHILLIIVHHLVFDGASAAALTALLWQAYGHFADKTTPLPEIPTDFSRFAAWEADLIGQERGQAQRAYWLEQLAGPLPVLDLSPDRPARPGQAVDGQSLEKRLPATSVKAAKRLARKLGITPAALYLAVLSLLAQRQSGHDDMIIGVPALRRPSRAFAATIGYCVNMLALRLRPDAGISAASWLRRVHAQLVEAADHGDYPFAAIARQLGTSLGGEAPYQISFAYQNFPLSPQALAVRGQGEVSHMEQLRQAGDGPFGLEVYEDGETVQLVAGYDGNCFEAGQIEAMLERFAHLLKAVCATPQAPLHTLEVLPPSQRKNVERWSMGPDLAATQEPLIAQIARHGKARAQEVAVIAEGQSVTYRQLLRRSNRLARHLQEQGIGQGSAVAVLLGRDPHAIVALLAVLTIGAVWVPLDADAPDQRLALMLDDCRAQAIITTKALAAMLPAGSARPILIDGEAKAIAKQSPAKLKPQGQGDDPAYMIYTSGSTGTPKGVVVSHQAIADHCRAVIDHYGLDAADVVLQFAPHVVDTALEQILPTLAAGAKLVLRTGPVWNAQALQRILADHAISVADLPPAYLREVLLAWGDRPKPAALRLVLVGGEAIAADTVRLWQDSPLAGCRLLNAYGPTECTITCLVHDIGGAATGPTIPIGRPLAGTRVHILDRHGNQVPEGAIGQLHVGGSRLALGYHRRADLNAEKFIEAPAPLAPGRLYRTGDLASFMAGGDGVIAFHGRLDDQVKIRGYRVELGEVEAALSRSGLRQWAVVTRHDGAGTLALVAYVVADGAFDEADLRARMARQLPAAMLPSAYVALPALPLTPSGKLDRAALPAPTAAGLGSDAPGDDTETMLADLWAAILEREAASIGIHDDFQECGGHSLAWVRLLHAIEQRFHVTAEPQTFVHARTIAAQARLLRDGTGDAPAAAPVIALRPGNDEHAAPLFLVHAVAGTVECYRDLARRITAGVSVFALAADDADFTDLAALAADYVQAIRRVRPHGPYRLGGWSLGGIIAFEMARHLLRQGESVQGVYLIDSYAPALLRRLDGDNAQPLALFARDVLGLHDMAFGQEDDVTTLLSLPGLAGTMDEAQMHQLYRRFRRFNDAVLAHQPQPQDIALTLLRAAHGDDGDPTRGWAALTTAGLAVHVIPGDHLSILRAPNLDACAMRLNDGLI